MESAVPEALPDVWVPGAPEDEELEDEPEVEVEVDGSEGIDDDEDDGIEGIDGIEDGEGWLGEEVALLVAQPASNAAVTAATGNSRADRMFRYLR